MITDNYIKMCEQAEEIQKEWKPKSGDNFSDLDYEVGMILLFPVTKEQKQQFIKDKFWLLTQEQLQEMVWDKTSNIQFPDKTDALIYSLRKFREQFYLVENFDLFNELWLAFVMKEKYNKIWTGEEWKNVT